MSNRQLVDWISGYLTYTENTEPKRSYHNWMAVSCIAAALERKVRLIWGHETIYPNIYVILVGPSGRARKGAAMSIAQDILKDVGIPMTGEDITREQLIRKMKDAANFFNDNDTGRTVTHSSITCFSEELSVFLGQNDIRFLSTLTNWYDSRDSWTYETKTQGKDTIQGVCFTMVGATAPDWISSMFPQEAIGGGFTSRVIFVVEDGKGKTVEEHILTETELNLRESLVIDLQHINQITGEFVFSEQCRATYVKWYRESEKLVDEGSPPIDDPRFEGYVARRATHLRKLSMIMSASRSSKRVVEVKDFERARRLLQATEITMPKAFGGVGRSPVSESVEMVLDILQTRKTITKSELLYMTWRDLDTPTLKIVEDVLIGMKVMKMTISPLDGVFTYTYIGGEK